MATTKTNKPFIDFKLLRRIFQFVKPYRKTFYITISLSVLLAILAPIRPYLIQISLNEGLRTQSAGVLFKGVGGFVIEITIIQIGLLIVESIARFFFTFLSASLGQHVVKDLRTSTYKKILNLNLSQFDKTPIGTLTTRTINDIESVNDIFSDGLVPILADLLAIVSILIYMFWIDWELTFICLLSFPLLIIATRIFKESVNKSFIKVRNAVSNLNAFVQEHISGMSVVQAFAAETREQEKFAAINKQHRNANVRSIFAYSVFFPFVELISALSIGLLIWWAAKGTVNNSNEFTGNIAGIVTSFILCINLLFRPLRMLADKFNVLQMGMIAGERVIHVLDNSDTTQNLGNYKPEVLKGEICFQNVWFSYDGSNYVLKDVSFTIKAGQTVALVGQTGSGKTSIISLINRLYPVTKGKILIDGVPIEEYELGFLRARIGVVLQDVFLFSGSVLDNITLRDPGISKIDAENAAKLIDMHDFIQKLPSGYDFEVMERGATMSHGQRQLLSFVRAVLYNPQILILDEATSSIDVESELLIQQATEKLVKGRTAIVIAHRLSTIRNSDQIIVLDKGEIKEMGAHEELIALKGYYSGLSNIQFDVPDNLDKSHPNF